MNPLNHLQIIKPSYIREILNVTSKQNIISLAGGLPCPESFPMEIIQKSIAEISQKPTFFQYAETAGFIPLINYLNDYFNVPTSHKILITNGSQQGIDLCTRVFVDKHEKVLVETPCYLGALQIFAANQVQIIGILQEHDGPHLQQLEETFAKENIKFFYATPDFQNPTGRCWSLEKRLQVAKLCINYNILFIEDAPYRELRFTGTELPTVSSFCPEHSIILRSFSKTISPALRVAALITPRKWFPTLSKLKQASDLHTSIPTQYLINTILQDISFNQHLSAITKKYHLRYKTLQQALSYLPKDKYSLIPVEGGMFVWLQIPPCDTLGLAQKALKNGVAVVPSSEFMTSKNILDGNSNLSALRLNFSYNNQQKIKVAVERIMPLLESLAINNTYI